ncbi:Nephrocystin-3 [Dactylellina cionopaga]|nr:Nephrocystin-3 [Dactylellina cionopaga]
MPVRTTNVDLSAWEGIIDEAASKVEDNDDRIIFNTPRTEEEFRSSISITSLTSNGGTCEDITIKRQKNSIVNRLVNITSLCLVSEVVSLKVETAEVLWNSFIVARFPGHTLQILNLLEDILNSTPIVTKVEYTNRDAHFVDLEQSMLSFYSTLLQFNVQLINFLQSNHTQPRLQKNWNTIVANATDIKKKLESYSQRIERANEAIVQGHYYRSKLNRVPKSEPKTRLPCHLIPFNPNSHFLGREDILEVISEHLAPNGSGQMSFAIYGLGGVGKSQTALSYVYESVKLKRYPAIFWVAAETHPKLAQSYNEIAQGLGLVLQDERSDDFKRNEVKRWLSETEVNWLIVFDNVNRLDILENYWPTGNTGSVLLTSQDVRSLELTDRRGIEIASFTEDESMKFLLSTLSKKSNDPEMPEIRTLAQKSYGLPLALQTMVSFILGRGLSVKKFLQLYEKHSAKINTRKGINWQYDHTLATVWDFAFTQLGEDDESEDVTHLLELFAFLDPDNIPESLFFDGEYDASEDHIVQQGGELPSFVQEEMEYIDSFDKLLRTSLISKKTDQKSYTIHRLVRNATFNKSSIERRKENFKTVLGVLRRLFPVFVETRHVSKELVARTKGNSLILHVLALKERYMQMKSDVNEDSILMAELLNNCGWFMYQRGLFKQAEDLVELAKGIACVEDSTLAADIVYALGGIYFESNRVELAKEAAEQTIAIRTRIGAYHDCKTAHAIYALGNCYLALNYAADKVEPRYHEAMEVLNSIPDEPAFKAIAQSNLAICLFRKHEQERGIQIQQNAISMLRASCGIEHERYSEMLFNLGNMRAQQRNYNVALDLHKESLRIREEVLKVHDKTAYSMHNVGSILALQTKYPEAKKLLEKAIDMFKKGTDSVPKLARSTWKLAQIMKAMGSSAEALNKFDEAFELKKVALEAKNGPGTNLNVSYNSLVNAFYSGLIVMNDDVL